MEQTKILAIALAVTSIGWVINLSSILDMPVMGFKVSQIAGVAGLGLAAYSLFM